MHRSRAEALAVASFRSQVPGFRFFAALAGAIAKPMLCAFLLVCLAEAVAAGAEKLGPAIQGPSDPNVQTSPPGQTFNAPALKVNTQIVSIRQVEAVFMDSYVLIQDKLRKGELKPAALGEAIRMAWAEALETATQDSIIDQRADRRRKDIIHMYLARAGGDIGSDRALEYYRREETYYVRLLRRELVAAAGGEEELAKALKRRGQTMQEWEAGLSRELFRRDVLALELGPVARSPGAARAFYDKHPELFKESEAWRLRRIRIGKDRFKSPEVALEAAKMVCAKIAGGSDFEELALKVSNDPEFAGQGGLLTRDGKTDLPGGNFPFEEHITEGFLKQDGQVSDPVDGGAWYVIVQRVAFRPMKIRSFEEAGDQAAALAYSERLKQKRRELFDKLRHESYIEVLQKDPPEHLLKGVPQGGDFLPPEKQAP